MRLNWYTYKNFFRLRPLFLFALILFLILSLLLTIVHNRLITDEAIKDNDSYCRIAVFPMFAEEILIDLVSTEKIVYVGHGKINDENHYYPSADLTQNIPGSPWQNCDEAFLLSLHPDLVIIQQEIEEHINSIFPTIVQSGIKIIYLSEPKGITDIENCIIELGKIVGEVSKASMLVNNMYISINKSINILNRLKIDNPIKVVYYCEWQESFPIISSICGLNNFADNNIFVKISDRDLNNWNPDIIFFNPITIDTDGTVIAADSKSLLFQKNVVMSHSSLLNTSAVYENNVYPLVPYSSHLIQNNIEYIVDCISKLFAANK